MRFLTVFASVLVSSALANGQFTGAKAGNKNELVKITFEAPGTDFKLICIPANTDWEAAQPLQSQAAEYQIGDTPKKTIYFVPKADAKYTFVLATSAPLALFTHEIVIGSGVPTPLPTPTPPVPNDAMKAELAAAYLTSPSASDAALLHSALTKWAAALDANKYTIDSNAAKADLKQFTTDTKIAQTALRPFRDTVTELLTKAEVKDRRAILNKAISVLAEQKIKQKEDNSQRPSHITFSRYASAIFTEPESTLVASK